MLDAEGWGTEGGAPAPAAARAKAQRRGQRVSRSRPPAHGPADHSPEDSDQRLWRAHVPSLHSHGGSDGETKAPSERQSAWCADSPAAHGTLCPSHSLDGVVAGEGDEAPEGQREGVEDLGPRVKPGDWVGQLRDLRPNRPSAVRRRMGGAGDTGGAPKGGQEPGGKVTAEATSWQSEGRQLMTLQPEPQLSRLVTRTGPAHTQGPWDPAGAAVPSPAGGRRGLTLGVKRKTMPLEAPFSVRPRIRKMVRTT